MATSVIGAGDLSKLRSNQYIERLAMYITPLVTVQTGTITAVPTLSPFVTLTVSWDGSTTGVKIGQLVKIYSGSTIRSWGMVRKAPSGSAFYVTEISLGSKGTAARIETAIQANDLVIVYTFKPLKSMYSRIAGKTFYKQWDLPYTNQNSQPPPVANTGPWQAYHLKSTETTYRFTLPRANVNTSFAFGSATISSRLWVLPAGVTIVSPYTTADAVIQVDAIAGNHLIELQITDSNAKTHSAFMWLFVSNDTTELSLDQRYAIDQLQLSQTRQGFEFSFTMTGESLDDALYPGAAIMLREWTRYDDEYLTDGVPVDTFVGYISEIEISHDGNIGTASIKVLSPYLFAELLAQPPQALEEKMSPARWTECTSALSNPRGFLYYLIKWHTPNLLDMHDFDAPYITPRRRFGEFGNATLQGNLNVVAEYIAGNVGSSADGTTVLRKNPMYMSTTDRNTIATIITLLEQDVSPEIKYMKALHQKFGEAFSGAFAFDGSTIKAWRVGKRWYGGSGQSTLPNFTVTATEGVSKAKEIVGHFMAEQNCDVAEIIFTLNAFQDVVDPSLMLWIGAVIDAEFDTYGDGFNDRLLPLRVEREWELTNDSGWVKTIRLSAQLETFGQPGEEIPVANLNAYQIGGFSVATPIIFEANQQGVFGGVPLLIAHDDNGKLGVTYNYLLSSPTYVDLTPSLNSEIVNDWCLDYGSDYFSNGNNPSSALGLWVITVSGTSLKTWYFSDILTNTIATLINTVTMSDSSCDTEARIEVSELVPTLIVIAWHDRTGTCFIRSTNGGTSWSSKANIGNTISDNDNDNGNLALAIHSEIQIVSAPDGSGDYGLYIAITAGGSFSAVTNTERDPSPMPLAKMSSTSQAFVATRTRLTDVSEIISFDSGGYSDYVDSSVGYSPSIVSGGQSGNCYGAVDTSGLLPDDHLGVEIDLGGTKTISQITAYGYCQYTGSVDNFVMRFQIDSGTIFSSPTVPRTGVWTQRNANTLAGWAGPYSGQIVKVWMWHPSTTGMFFPIDVRLDTIEITTSEGFGTSVNRLFRVSSLTGTPTWTEITPETDQAPERPHDLSVDLIDTSIVNFVSGDDKDWRRSLNSGTAWTLMQAASNKRVPQTAKNAMLFGGNGEIVLAFDGSTFVDKIGNLATVWGSVGTIKRIAAL